MQQPGQLSSRATKLNKGEDLYEWDFAGKVLLGAGLGTLAAIHGSG